MTELVVGKYEFYPYEFDEYREIPSLEELLEFLKSTIEPRARRTLKRPLDLWNEADHAVNDVAKRRAGAGSPS